MNKSEFIVTLPELARILNCSRGLIYDLARQDKLPLKVIHLGGKRMVVSRKAVEALLEANTKADEH